MRPRIFFRLGVILTICLLAFFLIGRGGSEPSPPVDRSATPPAKTIRLLPLGPGCTPAFIQQTHRQLRVFLPDMGLSAPVPLPASAFYPPRGRYRADSLIHWMSRQAKSNEVLLGITTVDISTTKEGKPDWGVMGLGFCPGNAAVASSFRMKNKPAFWKVAIHELGHTAGLPHCPVKTCFMRDADGGNPTAEETAFCPKCRAVLVKAGWSVGR